MRKHAKNLFIPYEGNEYRPHILQRISIAAMLILILLSFTAANIQALLWIGSDWLVSTILPAVIVERTNEERLDGAVTTLARNSTLDVAAQLKAEHMAENEYFAHYSPDGVSPWYWFDEVSYPFVHAGENLAVHFTDSNEVVAAWMDSPGHRANILNGNFTEIGVGTARGTYQGFDTVYVVQLFGAPAAVAQTLADTTGTLESTASAPEEEITVEVTTEDDAETSVSPASIETVTVTEGTQDTGYTEEIENGTEIEVTEVAETDDSIVVYSGLATASRDAIPATTTLQGTGGTSPETVSVIARTATQPSAFLQLFYSMLALLVIAALTLSIVIEWRRQHPVQIAYGTGLLAVMALLTYVHTSLTSGVTIM
jgi:hypothetical protein